MHFYLKNKNQSQFKNARNGYVNFKTGYNYIKQRR